MLHVGQLAMGGGRTLALPELPTKDTESTVRKGSSVEVTPFCPHDQLATHIFQDTFPVWSPAMALLPHILGRQCDLFADSLQTLGSAV